MFRLQKVFFNVTQTSRNTSTSAQQGILEYEEALHTRNRSAQQGIVGYEVALQMRNTSAQQGIVGYEVALQMRNTCLANNLKKRSSVAPSHIHYIPGKKVVYCPMEKIGIQHAFQNSQNCFFVIFCVFSLMIFPNCLGHITSVSVFTGEGNRAAPDPHCIRPYNQSDTGCVSQQRHVVVAQRKLK